jgi:hypothetical protein
MERRAHQRGDRRRDPLEIARIPGRVLREEREHRGAAWDGDRERLDVGSPRRAGVPDLPLLQRLAHDGGGADRPRGLGTTRGASLDVVHGERSQLTVLHLHQLGPRTPEVPRDRSEHLGQVHGLGDRHEERGHRALVIS